MCIDELDDWRKAQSGVNMQETLERLIMQASAGNLDLTSLLRLVRREYVADVLRRCNGKQGPAAAILGKHRNTVSRDVAEFGLPRRARGRSKA